MAKKKTVRNVQEIADELLSVRLEKAELATKDKLLSVALKSHPDFKKQSTFALQPSLSIIIKDREAAVEWAEKAAPAILTIDLKAAKRIFEMQGSIPTGFESKLVDRLVQAGSKEESGYDIG